jgi:hypothetical protein
VIVDRDRGSERALCCNGKRCLVLEHGAEAGVRGSVAVMEGRELNRGRRCTVMWVFPHMHPCSTWIIVIYLKFLQARWISTKFGMKAMLWRPPKLYVCVIALSPAR